MTPTAHITRFRTLFLVSIHISYQLNSYCVVTHDPNFKTQHKIASRIRGTFYSDCVKKVQMRYQHNHFYCVCFNCQSDTQPNVCLYLLYVFVFFPLSTLTYGFVYMYVYISSISNTISLFKIVVVFCLLKKRGIRISNFLGSSTISRS